MAHRRIAPAYLFAGPPGVGRRRTAACFALALVQSPDLALARQAALQRRIQQDNHPDVLWLTPTYLHQGKLFTVAAAEAAGLRRKSPPQVRLEQIRQLASFLSRPPLEAPRAVVIIEGAETMAEAAANGLLKTLEEPGQATLILLAPGINALLPTLVSRCQIIPFLRLDPAAMAQVLAQAGHSAIQQQPQVLAMAQGSPGMAIQAAQQRQTMPPELLARLETPPSSLRDALDRGRQVAKALDPEQQLWLADYLQQCYWQGQIQGVPRLRLLEQTKGHLRRYGQPRLVWEVTWMGLWQLAQTGIAPMPGGR